MTDQRTRPPPCSGPYRGPPGSGLQTFRVWVNIDRPAPGFDVVAKICGPDKSYLAHISRETGANVSLRGRGSGHQDPETGREVRPGPVAGLPFGLPPRPCGGDSLVMLTRCLPLWCLPATACLGHASVY